MLDSDVDRARPPAGPAGADQRGGTFGKRNDLIAGFNKRNQFAEPPHSAAVNGFAAQAPLVPGAAKLLRIERGEFIFDVEQSAAKGAKVPFFFRVLARQATFFNALEIGRGHRKLSVVSVKELSH